MRVERFMFSIDTRVSGDSIVMSGKPQITIKPERIITNSTAPDQVIFESFKFNNDENLAIPFDAYLWSGAYHKKVVDDFMKEIGVTTLDALYEYCDVHDLSIPDTNRVSLPSIQKGQLVEIRGKCNLPLDELFIVSIQGMGRE
jgi:hypothetical protein